MLTDIGEEYLMDILAGNETPVSSIEIGLYNSSDALAETNDVGDITTEPTGASYARKSASLPSDVSVSIDAGDYKMAMTATKTFDTSDSSVSVDQYFVVVNFDSDEASDGGTATDHLFWTQSLDQTYDLDSIDDFDLTGIGVKIT